MKIVWTVVIFLMLVAGYLGWLLLSQPPAAPAPQAPQEQQVPAPVPPAPETEGPLHEKVSVVEPASGGEVGKSFEVKGDAPGNWYFEASFPIQVRDKDGAVIGRGIGQSQGEWMTKKQVPFKASVTIENVSYKGPATLILLRDNPSGLPENDDSLEIPISVKQ